MQNNVGTNVYKTAALIVTLQIWLFQDNYYVTGIKTVLGLEPRTSQTLPTKPPKNFANKF